MEGRHQYYNMLWFMEGRHHHGLNIIGTNDKDLNYNIIWFMEGRHQYYNMLWFMDGRHDHGLNIIGTNDKEYFVDRGNNIKIGIIIIIDSVI